MGDNSLFFKIAGAKAPIAPVLNKYAPAYFDVVKGNSEIVTRLHKLQEKNKGLAVRL